MALLSIEEISETAGLDIAFVRKCMDKKAHYFARYQRDDAPFFDTSILADDFGPF